MVAGLLGVLVAVPFAAATPDAPRSFDMRVPAPPMPVVIDGVTRLVYELHLTSFARAPLVLASVEALDAEGGGVLAELRGDALASALSVPGGASVRGEAFDPEETSDSGEAADSREASDPGEAAHPAPDAPARRSIAPGTNAVLYLEIALDAGVRPRALEHRVSFQPAASGGRADGAGQASGAPPTSPPMALVGGRSLVRDESPPVLGPPLRGDSWVAVHHPSWERGHRRYVYAVDGRARIPGRFAVDWVKVDAEGRRARGDANVVRNWYGYGAEVLAVADGVVAQARDDVAESPTLDGQPDLPLEDGAGNYVALDLGNGRFAFYEHLKPGSVRVRPGDAVRRGQVVAAVGFTGHSAGPHLHFHVADANAPLAAEGQPFVLDRFQVRGRYGAFQVMQSGPWVLDGSDPVGARRAELPGPNVVVDFER